MWLHLRKVGGAVATCVGGSGVTGPQTEGTWLHSGLLGAPAPLCDRVCRVWMFVFFFPFRHNGV